MAADKGKTKASEKGDTEPSDADEAAKKAKSSSRRRSRKKATPAVESVAPIESSDGALTEKHAQEVKPDKAPKADKKAEPDKAPQVDEKPAAKPPAKAESAAAKTRKKADGPGHLVTGFPGFIGTRLVRKLAGTDPKARFALLVEARILARAEATLRELETELPGLGQRAQLIVGDITSEHLGVAEPKLAELRASTTTVWHLAAIYDLAVDAQVAYRVNVVGTSNVLDFCESCPALVRLNYVSTCYVSGDRTGLILETELDGGQGHKNHYERTKFWAEVEVQRRLEQVPATILRPGIVVGDSRSGETDKYDGPYFMFNFLLRLPSWFPMVHVGRGDALVNLVPVDFVVDAMATLGGQPATLGRVFQLADPNPMRARDIISLTLKVLGRRPPVATVPVALFERLLDRRRARRLLGMPKEAVAYFNHSARYDVSNTLEHLADTPVRCPHLSTYLSTLIDYVQRNPKKQFLDGRAL